MCFRYKLIRLLLINHIKNFIPLQSCSIISTCTCLYSCSVLWLYFLTPRVIEHPGMWKSSYELWRVAHTKLLYYFSCREVIVPHSPHVMRKIRDTQIFSGRLNRQVCSSFLFSVSSSKRRQELTPKHCKMNIVLFGSLGPRCRAF